MAIKRWTNFNNSPVTQFDLAIWRIPLPLYAYWSLDLEWGGCYGEFIGMPVQTIRHFTLTWRTRDESCAIISSTLLLSFKLSYNCKLTLFEKDQLWVVFQFNESHRHIVIMCTIFYRKYENSQRIITSI